MRIDVALTPDTFCPKDVQGKCVAVIDVLRACTTIVTALANGAQKVIPVRTPEEAFKLSDRYAKKRIKLCGERHGIRIPGFDLGNSPAEYTKSKVSGRILLYTSTNGSQTIIKACAGKQVFIAGFINVGAVIKWLAQSEADCCVVCSGREGRFSLEDAVCAGMIVNGLKGAFHDKQVDRSNEALAAEILYQHFRSDLEGMIKKASHGKYLTGLGMGKDLLLCISVDRYGFVPVVQNGSIVSKTG